MTDTLLASTQRTLELDLAKSGITPEDLDAYLARDPEIMACKIGTAVQKGLMSPGYVIPYYGIDGKKQPFYRVRVFNPLPGGAKYLQPQDSSSFIYFPKAFNNNLKALIEDRLPNSKINGFRPHLIICEGEKKASKAAKEGFLAVALGGVYNWKSRTLTLPGDVKIERDESRDLLRLKIPNLSPEQSDSYEAVATNKWAVGFQEVISLVRQHDWNVVIIYDTDIPEKPQVQKAAASLAFELRAAGIPINRIRQLKLPVEGEDKVGLDDYLKDKGASGLVNLIHEVLEKRCAFPALPNMREYVNNKLKFRMNRSELKELASAILTDMDINGVRLRDKNEGVPYYFDSKGKKLLKVSLMHNGDGPMHETLFGRMLYQKYDISQADTKLIPWLAAAITGEDPVYDVQPHSVYALTSKEELAVQINDGQYALVTGNPEDPIKICNNGDNGLLFKADQVEPIDPKELLDNFREQSNKKFVPWWVDTVSEFKFVRENDRKLASVLFYISPWLLRWKGTQLPVELMIGEPGSGKSSMYMLRMKILTGRPALRNQASDVRDWYSSITCTDGLHVTDNVHFVSKEIRQRLSDEICRLTTEPDPYVELRKLYTTSANARIPVRSVFALTAIQQPFTAADILQRSVIFDLEAVGDNHDNDWVGRHLESHGGRTSWLAHHLLAIHLFLRASQYNKKWSNSYRSGHRLVNYEQALGLMAEVLGIDDSEIVRKEYIRDVNEQVSEHDWTMDGLKEFALYALPTMQKNPGKSFTSQHISDWCSSRDEFKENLILCNSRRVARYLKSHATMIERVSGIYATGAKTANRETYRVKLVNSL